VSDRESEIERICQAALDCPPEARRELLLRECGDESMRREVEGHLSERRAGDATWHNAATWDFATLTLP
jgi:hypothetical protein